MDLIEFLSNEPTIREATKLALTGTRILIRGSQGSSSSFLAAAAAKLSGRTVLYVVAHLDEADETLDELAAAGVDAARLPALEVLPGETGISLELFAERLALVSCLRDSPLWPTLETPTDLACGRFAFLSDRTLVDCHR